jgi:hypothetical protein
MGKKINIDKTDAQSDDTEDIPESSADNDIAAILETLDDPAISSNIDVAKIIKSTGGIQNAANSAAPMIDQIAARARLEAQRASALAMKEYRKQLQGIVNSMQGTIREEGTRVADQICARVTTQIRQAVLIETEKKALNLVDEFVLGWQIEAESMSQDLLSVSAEPTIYSPEAKTPEQTEEPEATTKKEPALLEKPAKPVESIDKEKASLSLDVVAERSIVPAMAAKKQSETIVNERPKTEQSENEKKVVFDFATFIAQSKSPVKS